MDKKDGSIDSGNELCYKDIKDSMLLTFLQKARTDWKELPHCKIEIDIQDNKIVSGRITEKFR